MNNDLHMSNELLKLKAAKDLSRFSIHCFDSMHSLFIPDAMWETSSICINGVSKTLRGVVEPTSNSIDECFINAQGIITPGVTVSLKANDYDNVKLAINSSLGLIAGEVTSVVPVKYESPESIPNLTPEQLLDLGLKHLNELNKIDRKTNPREWAQAYNRLKSLKSSLNFEVFQIQGSNDYRLLITARIDPLLETTFETTTSDDTFPQNKETNKVQFNESEILKLVKELEEPKSELCEASLEKSAAFSEGNFSNISNMKASIDSFFESYIVKLASAYKNAQNQAPLNGEDIVAMVMGYFEEALPISVKTDKNRIGIINAYISMSAAKFARLADKELGITKEKKPDLEPPFQVPTAYDRAPKPAEIEPPDRPSDVSTLSKKDLEKRRSDLFDKYREEKDPVKKQQLLNRIQSLAILVSLIPKTADKKDEAIQKFVSFVESELARGVPPRDMATLLEKIKPNYPQHVGLINQIIETLVASITSRNSLQKGLDLMADSDMERARKELERKREEAELKRIQDMKVDKSRNEIEQKVKPFETHKPLNPKGELDEPHFATMEEATKALNPMGTSHCWTYVCKCGNTTTCRCMAPKTIVHIDKCSCRDSNGNG